MKLIAEVRFSKRYVSTIFIFWRILVRVAAFPAVQ